MKPRESMIVLLRVLGVWELIHGFAITLPVVRMLWQLQGTTWRHASPDFRLSFEQYLWSTGFPGGIHLLAGLALLMLAVPLSRWFYPDDRSGTNQGTNTGRPSLVAEVVSVIPPRARLIIGVLLAIVLPVLSMALSMPQGPSDSVVGRALHSTLLVGIACAAVAFLVRNKWRPVPSFFVAWNGAFAFFIMVNAMRRIL